MIVVNSSRVVCRINGLLYVITLALLVVTFFLGWMVFQETTGLADRIMYGIFAVISGPVGIGLFYCGLRTQIVADEGLCCMNSTCDAPTPKIA